jgi:opacity protein-like surface antigen
MTKKIYIALLLVILVSLDSGTVAGQSLFSLNYIGEHSFRGGARDAALAYSTLAVPDSASALTMNPATTASLTRVTLGLNQRFYYGSAVYGENEASRNNYQLPAVLVAFPVLDGLVFNLGYRTRFEGKVDFTVPASVEGPEYGWSGSAVEEYSHNGSLYSVPLGVAWKINDRISVEGELHLERGSIRDKVTENLQNPDYGIAVSEMERNFSATSWGFALQAMPHRRLKVGAIYEAEINYSVNERIDHTLQQLNSRSSFDFNLPAAYGLGLSAAVSDRWFLTASYWHREAPAVAGFSQFENALGAESLFSAGIERRSSAGKGSFLSRTPLRIGYYEDWWHLEIPTGEPVISRFVTFGSGIDLPGGPGSLDFSFAFGRIGSEDANGLEENVIRMNLSVNVSEAWKGRERKRY